MNTSRDQLTRRSVITGAGTLGVAFLAACTSDGHPTDPESSIEDLPGPDRLRAEARHLEPTTYLKTYTVDATGKNGAHRTFAEAYQAISVDRRARLGSDAQSQSNPWDWRLIEVAPGTYHECIKGIPPHTAIVGQGRRPDDVRIWWEQGDNTFESTGRSTYMRNVHLEHTGGQADCHPMRENGSSGDIGLRNKQIRTIVFDSVRFTSSRTGSLGKCTNDMVPGAGTSLTFRNCTFDGPGQPQSVNLVTNAGAESTPTTVAFLGCTVISNHEQHPDHALQESGPVSAAPFGSPDPGRGRRDAVVWMDGHWDVGRAADVQALLVLPYTGGLDHPGSRKYHPATRFVLVNPGSVPGMTTVKAKDALPPTATVPADIRLPRACVSLQERAFFGTQPDRSGTTLRSGPQNGTVRVRVGDVYWVAVPLEGRALHATTVTIPALPTTAPQVLPGIMLALDHSGTPEPDGNGQAIGRADSKKPSVIPVQQRWFYPGQGPVWVGVTFDHDADVPATRAVAGRALHGTGASNGQVPAPDGLRSIPVGDPVPYVEIRNERPPGMA